MEQAAWDSTWLLAQRVREAAAATFPLEPLSSRQGQLLTWQMPPQVWLGWFLQGGRGGGLTFKLEGCPVCKRQGTGPRLPARLRLELRPEAKPHLRALG